MFKSRLQTSHIRFGWGMLLTLFLLLSDVTVAELTSDKKFRIFDGKPKIIIVNGYSTSFQWPELLQRKLDRFHRGKQVIQIKSATQGGTPIAKWMDIKTGRPLKPWRDKLSPRLKEQPDILKIVLCQQSLQWVYGDRRAGILSKDDQERIETGADVLEKYATLLKQDGADAIFIAMHIYKKPMEPQIGNERLALQALMKRKIPRVYSGPDVWTPTRAIYPRAFAKDLLHPNKIGAEIMAQQWFETLLRHDGLKVPPRSRQELRDLLDENVTILRDLEYVPGGHERQKLDLYIPKSDDDKKPLPVIVWVHGGAWRAGSKDNCRARRFLDHGFAAASINYRLSQHAIFPAQIEDCKAAIRYLRAHAKQYDLDPERIGVWGSSAGGHLVALLGTTSDVKEFDVGPNRHVSSAVQAVCDFFGPTDFTKMNDFDSRIDHDAAHSPESLLIGGPIQQNHPACQCANPITYVTESDPPFLICHGDKDPLVPHNQSVLLETALKKANVSVLFHTVEGGGHGFNHPQVDQLVQEFFLKHLKRHTEIRPDRN